MKKIFVLLALGFAFVLSACGVESEPLPDETEELGPAPACTYADPAFNPFNGCRPETEGRLFRHDGADGGIEVYQCTADGMKGYRCNNAQFHGEALYCDCE